MFSYEIFEYGKLVANNSGFENYTEMCIEIGGIMQKHNNTSECKDGYYCKVYENGKLLAK